MNKMIASKLVKDLPMSIRVRNTLRRNGVFTVADVLITGRLGLSMLPGIGSLSLKEITAALRFFDRGTWYPWVIAASAVNAVMALPVIADRLSGFGTLASQIITAVPCLIAFILFGTLAVNIPSRSSSPLRLSPAPFLP